MINYIKAELFRINHKRSSLIYYTLLSLAFCGLITISARPETPMEFLDIGETLFGTAAMFVTIQVFITVYCDDLNAKTLANVISVGLSRAKILLSKIIVTVFYTIEIVFGLTVIFSLLYFVYGGRFTSNEWIVISRLINTALITLLASLAFSIIASIAVFGLQSTVVSVISYLALLTSMVYYMLSNLLALVFPSLSELSNYLITPLIEKSLVSQSIEPPFIVAILAYSTLATALSIILFKRKELSV